MYGGTFNPVQRPTDDQFYCVIVRGDRAIGKMGPESMGTFDEKRGDAASILAGDATVTQVQIHNKGNFWHREVREPYCAICMASSTEPAFEHEHLMVTSGC